MLAKGKNGVKKAGSQCPDCTARGGAI